MAVMLEHIALTKRDRIHRPTDDPEGLILEAWAQGFMVGTLVFMAAITVANMRRHVLLHKLILAEVRNYSWSFFLLLQRVHHAANR
jgi:hypothetical protein